VGGLGLVLACAAPPNDTPTERSGISIVDAVPAEPLSEGRGLERIASELPDLSAVCEHLRAHECSATEGDCYCYTELRDESLGWALPMLQSFEPLSKISYPAIRTTTGWTLFRPWVDCRASFHYADPLTWGEVRQLDLLMRGEPELLFTFEKGHITGKWAPDDSVSKWTMQAICTRDGDEARCTRPLLEQFERTQSRPTERHDVYAARVVLEPNVVAVSEVRGAERLAGHAQHNAEVLVLPEGRHALVELLAAPQ
jgi:hypothetical protein